MHCATCQIQDSCSWRASSAHQHIFPGDNAGLTEYREQFMHAGRCLCNLERPNKPQPKRKGRLATTRTPTTCTSDLDAGTWNRGQETKNCGLRGFHNPCRGSLDAASEVYQRHKHSSASQIWPRPREPSPLSPQVATTSVSCCYPDRKRQEPTLLRRTWPTAWFA